MNKYREICIYEIENGFILKYIPKDNTTVMNPPEFISLYTCDIDNLVSEIKELLK